MKDNLLSRDRNPRGGPGRPPLRIASERQAAALRDPLRRRLVLSLVTNERSVADLARDFGLDIRRLHYHVTCLAGLGLIEVVREEPRAGRPVKLYRAVAPAFLWPEGLGSPSMGDALAGELREILARERQRAGAALLLDVDEAGRPRMRPVDGGTRSAAPTETWRVLRLSRADARELERQLSDCLRAFESQDTHQGTQHLVHIAVAARRPGRR